MLARNALRFIVATALTAAAASAQQPKPAPTTRSTSAAQAPAAAKKAAKTSAATALPINADSARKIVVANASGATVTSTHLRRNAANAYYAVSYKLKGGKKTMHATVDANTGAFTATAPAATAAKPAAKKPS